MLGPFSKKQCSQLRKQGQITLYLLAPFSVFRVCVHVRVCVRTHAHGEARICLQLHVSHVTDE